MLAFVNNVTEIRGDASKLCLAFRRPVATVRAFSLGIYLARPPDSMSDEAFWIPEFKTARVSLLNFHGKFSTKVQVYRITKNSMFTYDGKTPKILY